MENIEISTRKCLEALDKAFRKIGLNRVGAHNPDKMVAKARQDAETVCKALMERGDIDTMPEISAWWDEASGGPVVEIKLPHRTLTGMFEYG